MIVWLNGAFGVGKTTTACELVRLLPRARTLDPERLGWALRRTVGLLRPGDYQHLWLWRRGTVRLADRKARRSATLVVSMTVLRPHYLDEFLTGLRSRGHQVCHVLLDAPSAVVRDRIERDEINANAGSWRREQLAAYERSRPDLAVRGITVDASTRSPRDLAAGIVGRLGVTSA